MLLHVERPVDVLLAPGRATIVGMGQPDVGVVDRPLGVVVAEVVVEHGDRAVGGDLDGLPLNEWVVGGVSVTSTGVLQFLPPSVDLVSLTWLKPVPMPSAKTM